MKLKRITLYPIKSLDGISVPEARISPGGALEYDREFAFFNTEGRTVNGKKYPAVHHIRSFFDLPGRYVRLEVNGKSDRFHLDDERLKLSEYFSDYLGEKVELRQNTEIGFPDADNNWGPGIVSTQSLERVRSWLDSQYSLDNVRRRFRVNLELEAPEPFWEDSLFGAPGTAKDFRIGDISFKGIKPCARCPVPTRNPQNGEVISGFSKLFSEKRKESLPDYVNREQFPHFYFLSVSTQIDPSERGKELQIGATVEK